MAKCVCWQRSKTNLFLSECPLDFNWQAIVVIVMAVSLAIAPIYWMRPSPRQNQLARLRSSALGLGLRPELREAPKPMRLAGFDEKLMRYHWYKPTENWPRSGPCWLAIRENGCFDWGREVGLSEGPQDLLESLNAGAPEQLHGVEIGPAGLGFYWHESGDEQRLENIVDLLQDWKTRYVAIGES